MRVAREKTRVIPETEGRHTTPLTPPLFPRSDANFPEIFFFPFVALPLRIPSSPRPSRCNRGPLVTAVSLSAR